MIIQCSYIIMEVSYLIDNANNYMYVALFG